MAATVNVFSNYVNNLSDCINEAVPTIQNQTNKINELCNRISNKTKDTLTEEDLSAINAYEQQVDFFEIRIDLYRLKMDGSIGVLVANYTNDGVSDTQWQTIKEKIELFLRVNDILLQAKNKLAAISGQQKLKMQIPTGIELNLAKFDKENMIEELATMNTQAQAQLQTFEQILEQLNKKKQLLCFEKTKNGSMNGLSEQFYQLLSDIKP